MPTKPQVERRTVGVTPGRPKRSRGLGSIQLPGVGSLSDELYEYLKVAVTQGAIPPGERLVEASLALSAGMSRTPVREALHRLEADGLIRSTAKGAVVTAFSDEELHDLCTARVGMEGLAARLAAEARSDLDVANLMHIHEEAKLATKSGSVRKLVELNHAFHEAIWRASRNRYLSRELLLLRSLIERLQPTTLSDRERQLQAFEEHGDLVDAIGRGDRHASEGITRHHFEDAMARRLANLGRQLRSG